MNTARAKYRRPITAMSATTASEVLRTLIDAWSTGAARADGGASASGGCTAFTGASSSRSICKLLIDQTRRSLGLRATPNTCAVGGIGARELGAQQKYLRGVVEP